MVNSEELIGTTEYLTCYKRRRINRYHYNGVGLYGLSSDDFIAKLVSSLNSEGFMFHTYKLCYNSVS